MVPEWAVLGFSTLRRVYRWCNSQPRSVSVSLPSRFSTLRRVYRWCNALAALKRRRLIRGFSTLRRVYRWCNTGTLRRGWRIEQVSVPSDGSTGGVTLANQGEAAQQATFQYPQTGLQVV